MTSTLCLALQALKEHAKGEQSGVILVSAQVESELMDLDEAEAAEYLADLGAKERGLHSLIRATYQQLGLRTYFTTGEKESRAWTIRQGMTAPQVGSTKSGGSVSLLRFPDQWQAILAFSCNAEA